MSRKLFALTSLALLSVLPVLTANVHAQTNKSSSNQPRTPNVSTSETKLPVEVTNISGLERRALGGHKAKVSYKVALPEQFKLKRIIGKIEFKLSDGSVQTGEYTSDTAKPQDTIEIAANGKLLKVDQEPVSIKANILAIADKPFNGFSSAKFAVNGTSISTLDGNAAQFPFNIDIPKISDFKRQALGGHQVRVAYTTPATPAGFTAKELRVKATFQLDGGKTQTNTVVKNSSIALSGSELVDTDGKVFAKDGEAKQIDTQVAIDGIVTHSGGDNRDEVCGGGECKK
jgi:hypothetical protein